MGSAATTASSWRATARAVLVNDPGVGVHGEDGTAGERPADDVVAEIAAAGGTAVADYSSVTDWDSCAAMVQRAVDELGGLDVVVNNAGIVRDRMITSMAEDDFDAVLARPRQGHVLDDEARVRPLARRSPRRAAPTPVGS